MDTAHLTIVQLSDLHADAHRTATASLSPSEVATSIRGNAKSHSLLIAFTGDIAFSGHKAEYDVAGEFIKELVRLLANDFKETLVRVLPGNHDVDLSASTIRESAIDGFIKHPPTQQQMEELAQAQRNFFQFQREIEGTADSWSSRLSSTTSFTVSDFSVQVSAVNTATCSRMNEIPGSLFVQETLLPSRASETDCHIAMLHHPAHWIHISKRQRCLDWVNREAEILLTGHEHQADLMETMKRNLPATLIVSGLALHDPEAEEQGFIITNVDLKRRTCEVLELLRCTGGYEVVRTSSKKLASASERSAGLRVTEEFLKSLDELNIGISHGSGKQLSHESIFVYPTLRVDQGGKKRRTADDSQFIDGALLLDQVMLERHSLLVGEEYSGKTFLLRRIFKDALDRGLRPLIVSAKVLNLDSMRITLEEQIRRQYGAEPRDYFQVGKDERILLIDDIDRLQDAHRSYGHVLDYCKEWFGASVCTCKELTMLRDPFASQTNSELWSVTAFHIAQFGFQKRAELIAKWVNHGARISEVDTFEKEVSLESRLNEILAQRAVPSLPMALTMLLESMDTRDEVDEATGAFGYHYQRLILQALAAVQSRRASMKRERVTDDTALELLGRLAYKVHAASLDGFDNEFARKTAIEMRDELIITFSIDVAIETLIQSSLIRRRSDGLLEFSYKYVYQFSVAKLLALWLNNDQHSRDVRRVIDDMVHEMHDASNASIIIFFTFLTRDSSTIRSIIARANKTFEDTPPTNFGKELDRFFIPEVVQLPKSLPERSVKATRQELQEANDRRDRLREIDESAAARVREDSRETLREIDCALQCMQVLGQILRAYPTRLSGREKIEVTESCYRLGLRTLGRLVELMEAAKSQLQDYFRKVAEGHVPLHDIEQMEAELGRQLAVYVELGSLAVVKRIARAVGCVHLRPLYGQIKLKELERATELITRAIGLELLGDLNHNETGNLYDRLRKDRCNVAASVLQWLVVEFVYLHAIPGSARQSILKKLGIKPHPAMLSTDRKIERKLPKHKEKSRRRMLKKN